MSDKCKVCGVSFVPGRVPGVAVCVSCEKRQRETTTYPNERDCKHGHFRPKCEMCQLEKELAEYQRTEPLKIDERNRLLAELNQAIKERDLLREGRLSDPLLKVTLEALTKERDDARECLREIVAGFVVCGCHRVRMYNHPPITENTLNRWCAGLEDA
jgi:hypothetical protein